MSISENIVRVRGELPAGVELVAVSKGHPAAAVREAYTAGQRVFGENRPQEMAAKHTELPADVRWHQIGHLQTNKVKLIVPFVEMIHSVDSARLAAEISRQATAAGRTIDCLFEIRIAREETKHGWEIQELETWLAQRPPLPAIRWRGLMGIATNTDDEGVVAQEFAHLARMLPTLRKAGGFGAEFDTLSIGMSDDYPLAIAAGSTMVRIGSAIFGARK